MKKICLSVVLSFVMLFGSSCSTKTSQLTPIRLNEVVHSIFYAPQYIALEKGYFKEEGLDVTVSVGNGADTRVTQRN